MLPTVKSRAALYQKINFTMSTICVEISYLYQKQHRVGTMPLTDKQLEE